MKLKRQLITAKQARETVSKMEEYTVEQVKQWLQALSKQLKFLDLGDENLVIHWPESGEKRKIEGIQLSEDGKLYLTAEEETIQLRPEDHNTHDLISLLEAIENAIVVKI